ncbi:hypothetical protein PB1_07977 [Bacillus methanolicus PB1]|uniref:Uncharacterized protein n=1 Tax=Bacillus methanolicus PB1 TaxID=997296 RepID=I3E1B2_BACMT|nr:hypothetical protein PB1_07977 [Bacillus methanolicus PB1]
MKAHFLERRLINENEGSYFQTKAHMFEPKLIKSNEGSFF